MVCDSTPTRHPVTHCCRVPGAHYNAANCFHSASYARISPVTMS